MATANLPRPNQSEVSRPVSLAAEFNESARVGPRVWMLVGAALVLGIMFPTFAWIALALWLVFVFPLAVGGLARWALAEILRMMATSGSATVVTRQMPTAPATPTERVVTGRVIS